MKSTDYYFGQDITRPLKSYMISAADYRAFADSLDEYETAVSQRESELKNFFSTYYGLNEEGVEALIAFVKNSEYRDETLKNVMFVLDVCKECS